MEETSKFKKYTDFLQDTDFIRWCLTKDVELEKRWEVFLNRHPEYRDHFKLAVEHWSQVRLNAGSLTSEEKAVLQQRIRTSVYAIKYVRKMRRWIYSGVAACILVLLGITFHWFRPTENRDRTENEKPAFIVGQALQAQDICLISGTSAASFKEDIQVKVGEDGSAKIVRANNKEEKIKIKKEILNKLVVPYGKRSKIELADGTRIWLNSGSVLEFPTHFPGSVREIRLSGEMYAEVAEDKSKPFIVHTSGFDVQVYGTRFNVSAYQDDPEPSCVLVQGHVGIRSATEPEIQMKENDRIVYRNNRMIKTQVEVSSYICWKDGYLEFDEASILDILDRIRRYYNLSFDFGDKAVLQKRKCSGKIYLSDNLDTVLTTLSILSSTEYRKENQTIIITVNPKN
ncbi:FecR family protein [Parabacteroides pacaensis]|uniref:FecR family protein n=1 Tax=Parabacteroides pacaensis TaxID=2086575 RepID=UPI000D0E5A87|nr:FecR domain-containing protein [Parabacteroides pacaensis]